MFDENGNVIVFDGTLDESKVLSEMYQIDWSHYINITERQVSCEHQHNTKE